MTQQQSFIGCDACGKAMTKVKNGYQCTTPGCGKGSLLGFGNFEMTVGTDLAIIVGKASDEKTDKS